MYYLDSSAVVKLVFQEAETKALKNFLENDMTSSDLTKIEVYRVCSRLDKNSVDVANKVFDKITFFEINKKIIDLTKDLVKIPYLKSLDSIHLATAIGISHFSNGLITYDKQMIRAAKELDLPVITPV